MKKIKRNRIRCNHCGCIVESRSVHDYRTCSCGAVSADGGLEYLRRCGDPEDFTELAEYDDPKPE